MLAVPFYRWANWGPERPSAFPEVQNNHSVLAFQQEGILESTGITYWGRAGQNYLGCSQRVGSRFGVGKEWTTGLRQAPGRKCHLLGQATGHVQSWDGSHVTVSNLNLGREQSSLWGRQMCGLRKGGVQQQRIFGSSQFVSRERRSLSQ